jgi:hypothetical protein
MEAQLSGLSSAKNIMARSSRISKAKLSAQIALDGYYQTGNTDKINLSGVISASAIDSVKEFSANGRFLYGENNKQVNQREYLAGIQYDYHPFSIVSPFLRAEIYKNEFKKIRGRYAGLMGVKYRYWFEPNKHDYTISVALLFDLENYVADVELPDKERLRLSIRPKFKHNLTETIYAIAEVYYKPNLADFCDFIVYGNFNINFEVFKKGLVRISYEHEYNNTPASSNVKKTDAMLLVGVGVKI